MAVSLGAQIALFANGTAGKQGGYISQEFATGGKLRRRKQERRRIAIGPPRDFAKCA